MAKQSGMILLGIGAMVLGGLYLASKDEGPGDEAAGLTVDGACDRIIVSDVHSFQLAAFTWAAKHSAEIEAMTPYDALAELWSALAGCRPHAGTEIVVQDRLTISWSEYEDRVLRGIQRMQLLGTAGGDLDGQPIAQVFVQVVLNTLRPTVGQVVLPDAEGSGGDGPFTPPGGRG